MKVTIDEKAKTMTIVVPLQEPRASKTGKTMLIASESDKKATTYKGQDVTVSMNAYFKA